MINWMLDKIESGLGRAEQIQPEKVLDKTEEAACSIFDLMFGK